MTRDEHEALELELGKVLETINRLEQAEPISDAHGEKLVELLEIARRQERELTALLRDVVVDDEEALI